jgi:hypothetical protein
MTSGNYDVVVSVGLLTLSALWFLAIGVRWAIDRWRRSR